LRLKNIIITGILLLFGLGPLSYAGDDDPCDFYRELAEGAPRIPSEVQRQQLTIEKYKEYISALLNKHGKREFVCSTGYCIQLSNRVVEALSHVPQFHAKRVKSQGHSTVQVIDTEIPTYIFHYFAVDKTFGDKLEIIIDSTYQQFIRNPESLDLPDVFVGTRDELVALFEKHQANMMPINDVIWLRFKRDYFKTLGRDQQINNPVWNPRQFVETNWSFESGAEFRVDNPPPPAELTY